MKKEQHSQFSAFSRVTKELLVPHLKFIAAKPFTISLPVIALMCGLWLSDKQQSNSAQAFFRVAGDIRDSKDGFIKHNPNLPSAAQQACLSDGTPDKNDKTKIYLLHPDNAVECLERAKAAIQYDFSSVIFMVCVGFGLGAFFDMPIRFKMATPKNKGLSRKYRL